MKDVIHIWQARLDGTQAASLAALLSDNEKMRAARFHRPLDRNRWIAGRGFLRLILGHSLGLPPGSLRFGQNRWGKPELCGSASERGLRFNLSHSGGQALYALAWGRAVGVDLEHVSAEIDIDSLSASFFPPDEISRLRDLPDALRVSAFYQTWTRMEALLKARGQGLGVETPIINGIWSVQNLPAPPGYRAALTVEGEWGEIFSFDAGNLLLLPNA